MRRQLGLPVASLLAAGLVAPASAQIGAPVRPPAAYLNSASAGLSYGSMLDRDATFWGWTVEYSRKVGRGWFAAGSLAWDRETETTTGAPDTTIDTFTLIGTVAYALTERLSVGTGLGQGIADTDNGAGSMRWTDGDLSTGLFLGWSVPGLPHFQRDSFALSFAYEYNLTKEEVSVSVDAGYGAGF